MTDTKLRILIYGQGHQYAGELAPDDVLDDPEENKNLSNSSSHPVPPS